MSCTVLIVCYWGVFICLPYICTVQDIGRKLIWCAQFPGGVHLPLVSTCLLYALVFPYIFLLVDCFEWPLIGVIEKQRVHSVLWQFQMGGFIVSFTQVNLKI